MGFQTIGNPIVKKDGRRLMGFKSITFVDISFNPKKVDERGEQYPGK